MNQHGNIWIEQNNTKYELVWYNERLLLWPPSWVVRFRHTKGFEHRWRFTESGQIVSVNDPRLSLQWDGERFDLVDDWSCVWKWLPQNNNNNMTIVGLDGLVWYGQPYQVVVVVASANTEVSAWFYIPPVINSDGWTVVENQIVHCRYDTMQDTATHQFLHDVDGYLFWDTSEARIKPTPPSIWYPDFPFASDGIRYKSVTAYGQTVSPTTLTTNTFLTWKDHIDNSVIHLQDTAASKQFHANTLAWGECLQDSRHGLICTRDVSGLWLLQRYHDSSYLCVNEENKLEATWNLNKATIWSIHQHSDDTVTINAHDRWLGFHIGNGNLCTQECKLVIHVLEPSPVVRKMYRVAQPFQWNDVSRGFHKICRWNVNHPWIIVLLLVIITIIIVVIVKRRKKKE